MQRKLILCGSLILAASIYPNQENLNDDQLQTEILEQEESKIIDKKNIVKEKLLILFDSLFGEKEQIIKEYNNSSYNNYQKALAQQLSGNDSALLQNFNVQAQQNAVDEEEKKLYFDDGTIGYCAKTATLESVKGFIYNRWKEIKEEQDRINKEHLAIFTGHKNIVEKEIIPALTAFLKSRRFTLYKKYKAGLEMCGNDSACLQMFDIQLDKINEEFLNKQDDFLIYSPIMRDLQNRQIPLTREQVLTIAATIALEENIAEEDLKGKTLVEQINFCKEDVIKKMDDIKNPHKKDLVQDKEDIQS